MSGDGPGAGLYAVSSRLKIRPWVGFILSGDGPGAGLYAVSSRLKIRPWVGFIPGERVGHCWATDRAKMHPQGCISLRASYRGFPIGDFASKFSYHI